jgi:hypothetical protein
MEITQKHKDLYDLAKLSTLLEKHGVLGKLKPAAKKELQDTIAATKKEKGGK